MFGNPFYHKLIKKYVLVFGTVFNDVEIVRMDKNRVTEFERIKVPIKYGPTEKYLARITQDPDPENNRIQIKLPIMSFEITGFNYDPSRKRNVLVKNVTQNTSDTRKYQYSGAPYIINFDLNIYTRSTDDANQIVEQILPIFNPDFNISQVPIDDMGFVIDVPLVLESVSNNIEYEGEFEDLRVIQWTLSFSMKVYFWGPVSNTGIIRTVFANTYIDPSIRSGSIVRVNLDNGNNGIFKIDDTVYQGNSINYSSATGIVIKWDDTNKYLMLGDTQGTFKIGNNIRAVSTNADYTITSFDASPLKVVSIKTTPDPIDALPEDDFGYTIEVKEYPEA